MAPFERRIARRKLLRVPKHQIAYVVISVTFVTLLVRPALAVEPQSNRKRHEAVTIQTDLITPIFGVYYLETNARASEHFSILLNTSYLPVENGEWKAKAGTLGVGLSYYMNGNALKSWYIEAACEMNFPVWRYQPSGKLGSTALGYTGLALGGYRFIWNSGLVLDVAAGVVALHLASTHVTTTNGSVWSEALTRVYPAAKLNLGWAF